MRWGLISDIHANAPALRAVLEELKLHDVDGTLCAGDVLGYYPFPNETVKLMIQAGVLSIQGNHDRAVLNTYPHMMSRCATDAALWAANTLGEVGMRYVSSLPEHLDMRSKGSDLMVYHGSPRSCNEYIHKGDATENLLDLAGCSILVLGHTHVPFVRRFSKGMIVNPGSVGQPRDGDPRASFSLIDTEDGAVENHRVQYDMKEMERRFKQTDLPQRLLDRLRKGV